MTKKIVGLYELTTGVFGVILIIANLFTKGKMGGSESIILQAILGVVLYAFLAYAGYGLLNGLKNAKRYSMALQAFQIPLLIMPAYIYKFSAAAFFSIGIKGANFNVNELFHGIAFQGSIGKLLYVGTFQPIDYAITMNPTSNTAYMVYVVPIIILLALLKIK